MRVFVSFASDDRDAVEVVATRLSAAGHTTFFDRTSIRPGEGYDAKIRAEIKSSELFIFFISPASVASGRYTLTEIKFVQEESPNASDRVLPVLLRATPRAAVPAYIRSIHFLEAQGDLAAEVVDAVNGIATRQAAAKAKRDAEQAAAAEAARNTAKKRAQRFTLLAGIFTVSLAGIALRVTHCPARPAKEDAHDDLITRDTSRVVDDGRTDGTLTTDASTDASTDAQRDGHPPHHDAPPDPLADIRNIVSATAPCAIVTKTHTDERTDTLSIQCKCSGQLHQTAVFVIRNASDEYELTPNTRSALKAAADQVKCR